MQLTSAKGLQLATALGVGEGPNPGGRAELGGEELLHEVMAMSAATTIHEVGRDSLF